MARTLRPQSSNTATQNDIRRAISSVDALIVNVEELREWQYAVSQHLQEGDNSVKSSMGQLGETISVFEKHFEKLFDRINKMDAKIKELDRRTSKALAASPLKTSQAKDGKKKEESIEKPNTAIESVEPITTETSSDNQLTRIET